MDNNNREGQVRTQLSLFSVVAVSFAYVRVDLNQTGATIGSDTFWIAAGAIGALVTLVFIYYQIRTERHIAAAEFLLMLWEQFYSEGMRKRRKEIATIIKDHSKDFEKLDSSIHALEVLDFFENMGLLVKKKVIPLEFVWSAYYYLIIGYWTAVESYVYWFRERNEDPTYYDGLEYLFKKTLDFDERRRHKKVVITPEDLKYFIDEEMKI